MLHLPVPAGSLYSTDRWNGASHPNGFFFKPAHRFFSPFPYCCCASAFRFLTRQENALDESLNDTAQANQKDRPPIRTGAYRGTVVLCKKMECAY